MMVRKFPSLPWLIVYLVPGATIVILKEVINYTVKDNLDGNLFLNIQILRIDTFISLE